MKKSGRSAEYIFGLWVVIAVLCGLSAVLGYALFSHFSKEVIAATTVDID